LDWIFLCLRFSQLKEVLLLGYGHPSNLKTKNLERYTPPNFSNLIFSNPLPSPLRWQTWAASQSLHALQLIYLKLICSSDFIFWKLIIHLSEPEYTTTTRRKTTKQTAQITVPKRTNQTFEMMEIGPLHRPGCNSKIIKNKKIYKSGHAINF